MARAINMYVSSAGQYIPPHYWSSYTLHVVMVLSICGGEKYLKGLWKYYDCGIHKLYGV